ncbi:hypothetical protein [Bowdeniella massiliensis]|uniref:hypothetical protein n=1 Tax=Bowdeniella massiliensis TaxID=2932264 RepID=UPI002027C7D5|nr:hypothetical protein [Bowdeniella massiliensis]
MTTPPRTRTSDPWTSHAAETTLDMPRSHRLVLAAFRDHALTLTGLAETAQ